FQNTFLPAEISPGRAPSSATPAPFGPRKRVQSPAYADMVDRSARRGINPECTKVMITRAIRNGSIGVTVRRMQQLTGIKVLDLSHALAGPFCTLLLSDYGATVYKLEPPDGGDIGRGWGPPFAGGEAFFFLGLNRGKQGICVNLKRPEGVEL